MERLRGKDQRPGPPRLGSADLDNLQKASRALTYEGMRNALLGQKPNDDQIIDRVARLAKGNAVTPKALGSLVGDLVFTPILPCRIVDTRNIGGRMAAGEIRDLNAANPGGNFSLQGGSDTDCGIPANPAALALSVTGLSNLTTGYLRVYPFDGTGAQGSPVPIPAVNTTVTNDMVVPTCQGCAQELKVFSTANTHYAAFVTGYFMAPEATALQCEETSGTLVGVAAGASGNADAPLCASGYTQTATNCRTTSQLMSIYYSYSGTCSARNNDVEARQLIATRTCCRVAGR